MTLSPDILKWARLNQRIRLEQDALKEKILKEEGENRKSMLDKKKLAAELVPNPGDVVETEYGKIQRRFKGKVTWKPLAPNQQPYDSEVEFIPNREEQV